MAKEENQEKKPANVYACIAAVAAEIAKIGIEKTDNGQYSTRKIDDVYNVLGPIMAKHGLVILPRYSNRICEQVPRYKDGREAGKTFLVTIDAEYDLISAHDGSRHTVAIIAEAADTGDKATNKAMSAAYKYLCLQTFCIPTEGDNDSDWTTHDLANAKPVEKPAAKEVKPATISEEEEITIREMLDQIPDDSRAKFFETFKVKKISEIRVIDYTRALSRLRATIGAKGGK